MKKNSLTTAVVAGIAGVAGFAGLANAVDLNPDGLGQVLIYPYYTVNKNQDTLISVVNTSAVGKAVKVRFLEGYNSREVLDFNLFLSPWDVWTAAVTQISDAGGAKVVSADKSCTFPVGNIPTTGQAFRTSFFDGSVGPKDGGPTDATRTREGYLELISMGDIIPGTALDKTVLHKNGVAPCDGGILSSDLTNQLTAPTGGLFGSGAIANVGEGTFFAYNADAIDGFTAKNLFTTASSVFPSLGQANSANASTPGGAVAYVFDKGQLITLDYADGIDAVSAVFTADAIFNEYQVDPAYGSNTDWVVNFPTKRFYVDKFQNGGVAAITPFVENFAGGASNIQIGLAMYDREEGSQQEEACGGFSPPNPGEIDCGSYLPFEVNVISFLGADNPDAGVESAVFGSSLVSNLNPFAKYGWLKMDFVSDVDGNALDGGVGHVLRPDVNGQELFGLPTTGFYAFNLINANAAPGMLANYSGVFRHRASRECTAGELACS